MTAGPSTAMQSSVLVLNRLYMAIQVMSVRRAFCLLFQRPRRSHQRRKRHVRSYDFESWREVSQFKAKVEGPQEHEGLDPGGQFPDSGSAG